MEHWPKSTLLDERGNPLDASVESLLTKLLPRFRRRYPWFRDELTLIELFEEAGRRIANRDPSRGPVRRPVAYAWLTLRSVASSWFRRGENQVTDHSLPSEEGEAILSAMPASRGSQEQIENAILLAEVLAQLSEEEQMVVGYKRAGFSAQEIAKRMGSTVVSVDTLFSRAKDKIRRSLGIQKTGRSTAKR